jgi:hypothetical protein
VAGHEAQEQRPQPQTRGDVGGVQDGWAGSEAVAGGGDGDGVPGVPQRPRERDQRQDVPEERRGDDEDAHPLTIVAWPPQREAC